MAIYADGVDRRTYEFWSHGRHVSTRLISVKFVERAREIARKRDWDIEYVEISK